MNCVKAEACIVCTDVSERREFTCRFDLDTNSFALDIELDPEADSVSFLEEETYIELANGQRIPMDECTCVSNEDFNQLGSPRAVSQPKPYYIPVNQVTMKDIEQWKPKE